jgi:DNA invertase Pin-like site-specific DNA recombinase
MRIIIYIRDSAKAQGESGLGLEAQQAAVESSAHRHPDMEMSFVAAFARTRMVKNPRSGERSYG